MAIPVQYFSTATGWQKEQRINSSAACIAWVPVTACGLNQVRLSEAAAANGLCCGGGDNAAETWVSKTNCALAAQAVSPELCPESLLGVFSARRPFRGNGHKGCRPLERKAGISHRRSPWLGPAPPLQAPLLQPEVAPRSGPLAAASQSGLRSTPSCLPKTRPL